jgi:hypothetical protein
MPTTYGITAQWKGPTCGARHRADRFCGARQNVPPPDAPSPPASLRLTPARQLRTNPQLVARDLYGDAVLWFSPDEIATLVALDERAKKIADVKAAFPRGRRLSDARPDRPSMGNDAAKDFSI